MKRVKKLKTQTNNVIQDLSISRFSCLSASLLRPPPLFGTPIILTIFYNSITALIM